MQTSIRSRTIQFALRAMALVGITSTLASATAQSTALTYYYRVTTFAGSAGKSGSVDGTVANALFNKPSGLCLASDGALYVADYGNSTVRRITSDGTVTTFLGTVGVPGSADGKNQAAQFSGPLGIVADPQGGVLYISDYNNNTIRQVILSQKVELNGLVSTYAGSATESGSRDGLLLVARFNGPSGIAMDSARNLYVADRNSHTIRKLTLAGQVVTIGGAGGYAGFANGPADESLFNLPTAVAVDSANNVYVADSGNFAIRKITPAGVVSTLAGNPGVKGFNDGVGSAALFDSPSGITVDSLGVVYVTDADNTIRGVSQNGTVYTMVGQSGVSGTNNGLGTNALVNGPVGIMIDAQRVGYIADAGNNTIRIGQLYETTPVKPVITSPSSVSAKQGALLHVQLQASGGSPHYWSAAKLPSNLSIDPNEGWITGTPTNSGSYAATITVSNAWGSAVQTLVINVASSIPRVSSGHVSGSENRAMVYQIQATDMPTNYGAIGLPAGLKVNPLTGAFVGAPVYAGEYDVTISARNQWGLGQANLHLSIGYAQVSGLFIKNVTSTYSKPYLADIEFTLQDSASADAHAVVMPPSAFIVRAYENNAQVDNVNNGVLLQSRTKKLSAVVLMDYSINMAMDFPDLNGNGISDGIDTMQSEVKDFIGQQPANSSFAICEFHSDDAAPSVVAPATSDRTYLNNKIDGILTNTVQGRFGGSRVLDAIALALNQFGAPSSGERRALVIVTDGNDTSSANVSDYQKLIATANGSGVKIYPVGLGAKINVTNLQALATSTGGRYLEATDADLLTSFASIGKDIEGVYNLRWATLNRTTNALQLSFDLQLPPNLSVSFNRGIASFGTNVVVSNSYATSDGKTLTYTNNAFYQGTNTEAYTGTVTTNYSTNYVLFLDQSTTRIPYYFANTNNTGDVRVGALNAAMDTTATQPTFGLYATYVPRYIRQLKIHYRANWPCVPELLYTNAGELMEGWSLTQTSDGAGGTNLIASSPNPTNTAGSIPFAAEGQLLKFTFRDLKLTNQAFSLFTVETNIYTLQPGGQSFVLTNIAGFITNYPAAPHATPIPWLLSNGLLTAGYKTNDIITAENNDPDKDGVPTWKEFQAGTNPMNSNSFFKVLSFDANPLFANTSLIFSTASNRFYRVEASSDLTNWTALVDKVSGIGNATNNGVMLFTDPRPKASMPHQYYRILAH